MNSEVIAEDVPVNESADLMTVENAWTAAERHRIELNIIDQELKAVEVVYRLYGVTGEERKVIEDK